MDKEKKLLEILTRLFGIRPIYLEDFNKIFAMGNKTNELRELEERYPEIGLARYETEDEGFSIVSLIATITRILIDKALAFDVVKAIDKYGRENALIVGVLFYDEKRPPEIEEIEEETIARFREEYDLVIENDEQEGIDEILNATVVDRIFILQDSQNKE